MAATDKKMTREQAGTIFMDHYGYVRNIAFRFAPSPNLTNDIIHDSYICFIENAERWEYHPTRIQALLKKVTVNIARRHWSRYTRDLPENVLKVAEYFRKEALEEPEITASWSHLDEKLLALRICLQKLSPKNRELIELLYFNQQTFTELVQSQKRSLEALYTQASRIRSILYRCIRETLRIEVDND